MRKTRVGKYKITYLYILNFPDALLSDDSLPYLYTFLLLGTYIFLKNKKSTYQSLLFSLKCLFFTGLYGWYDICQNGQTKEKGRDNVIFK